MLALVLLAATTLYALYHVLLYPLLLSPLRHVPAAHPLARHTRLWMLRARYLERDNRTTHAAHVRHGPVVLLGPREISVNCVDGAAGGIRSVYAGNFDKDEWYAFFANFGAHNMFSSVAHGPHSLRKRMLSHVYSKSFVQGSAAMAAITAGLVWGRLLPLLREMGRTGEGVEAYGVFNAYTMDAITAWVFGMRSSTNRLRDLEGNRAWLETYWSRFPYRFYEQEVPDFTRWMRRIGIELVPEVVTSANLDIEGWILGMCDQASEVVKEVEAGKSVKEEDVPTVYSKLKDEMEKDRKKQDDKEKSHEFDSEKADNTVPLRLQLASELWDHIGSLRHESPIPAGIFLTYAAWELSRCPEVQSRLREELLSLSSPPTTSSAPSLPRSQDVDALPLLHAVVMETLRIHPSIPGSQPRKTPYPSCTLGPYKDIPGGIRINAQAYSLHRNEGAFPRPEEWIPDRWLEKLPGETDKKERWFWAFGSGGRMCVGSNFAMNSNKFVLAAIYSNFRTSIIDDSGMEQSDGYTAPPIGKSPLILKFEELEQVS
ncbi:MAG: hypothetical protein LQ340_007149 [Diploschistes diacapsis]|nr:MAG: hypothetical protein LQ340_007149 [Diploschistes diacapsis]